MNRSRKVKIVCTIGPATSSREKLTELIEAGMNVARLNFSHGDHKSHGNVIKKIRSLSTELDVPIAILQDLAGPKVRVGSIANDSITLKTGKTFTLTTRDIQGSVKAVSVYYSQLPSEVEEGDTLMLADGMIVLTVERRLI